MPKVSVIIPAYNAMKYLPDTVNSVLGQTFQDFEIIIVNDGSSDDIEAWVAQNPNPQIQLISQTNQGLAKTRNRGIAHAKGEYIAFLDADDLWEPTKLEKQVSVLDHYLNVGLVYTWVAYIDSENQLTGRVFRHEHEGDVWKPLVLHNLVECGSVALVRRSCLETVGVFDENLSRYNVNEDWDMWLRIAAQYPFKVIKEALVYYRQTPSSASRNWKLMEESFQIMMDKAFATAPPELLYLRQHSYSLANICFAWKAIQSTRPDCKQATLYWKQAIVADWKVCFSREFVRLSLALVLMQSFGLQGYTKFLSTLYSLRRRMLVSNKPL
jgi:glycosyltransferase involved in cell wall biosynthesis